MNQKNWKGETRDLSYYLTMFKLKDHTTWRGHFARDLSGFQQETKNWTNISVKDITDKRVFRIDRLTGEIIPL